MSRAWLVGFVAVLMMATGCSSDGWTASSAPAPGEVLTEENFASTVVGAMVAAGTVQATMRTPEKLTTGQVRLGDQPAMRLSTGQGLARQETIVVDDHAYLRHGIGKFRELLDDESDEIDEIQRHFATNLVLELLAANHLEPDQFRHLGEEHIGNTPYERYALVFQREWVDEVFASEQQLPRMSFRFWLDEQHRVRRLLFTMYGEDFVADFSAWGHEVSIEAPAASEVLPAGSYVPLTRSTFAAATAGPEEGEVTFRMDMVTSDGMEMHGDIRGDGQKVLALDATYVEEGESFEALYVDRTFYARPTGEEIYFQLTGKDAEEVVADMESSFTMGTQFRDSMIERVTYRGPARIGGKSFHEYELAIDFEFIAEMAGEDMSKIPDYTFRVHLSDDHTIRRAVIDFDGKQSRFDYTRWGKPVDIQAPPAHLVDGMDAA